MLRTMTSIRMLVAITAVSLWAMVAGCSPNSQDDAAAVGGLVDVHLFQYDPANQQYVLGPVTVSEASFKRDTNQLCGRCHLQQVQDLKNSVHFKWASANDLILFPGGGVHGMIDRACGLPASTALINYTSDVQLDECGKCHTGRYLPLMEPFFAASFQQMGVPNADQQAADIVDGGLDCLICHAAKYRSVPADKANLKLAAYAPEGGESPTQAGEARCTHDDTDFDGDGQPDPLIDTDGDGVADAPLMQDRDGDGQPDTPWPTVAQDRSFEAVASIGKTTDETCLRCHEHAETGYKRGTPFRAGYDVHAASDAVAAIGGGDDRHCVACHKVDHHKFRRGDNVGGDMMSTDYPIGSKENQLGCTTCHDPSSLPQTIHFASHLDKIACEACHIPYTSGVTYSLWGHGANLTFSRNAKGQDTKLITLDAYLNDGTDQQVNDDWNAYKTYPTLMWYNGQVSFLAQSLAVRGSRGARSPRSSRWPTAWSSTPDSSMARPPPMLLLAACIPTMPIRCTASWPAAAMRACLIRWVSSRCRLTTCRPSR